MLQAEEGSSKLKRKWVKLKKGEGREQESCRRIISIYSSAPGPWPSRLIPPRRPGSQF